MSQDLHQHNDVKWDKCGYSKLDLKNKAFLDIGCWEGGFCIKALQAGASRVVGVDYCTSPPLRKNLEDHDFGFYQVDVQSNKFLALGRYDVVSCSGVIYHLEDPINTLMKLRLMTRETLIVESSVSPILNPDTPACELSDKELISNWWTPTAASFKRMLEITGFEVTGVFPWKQNRLCLHATPTNQPLDKILPRIKSKMEINGGVRFKEK